ncbi:MAG: dephospho-CoA kinase [Coriobacteriia bacterium]|nr:dephospho-CoA kinase [Coriobacteriia bacterium]
MKILAITGPFGSGKTTVTHLVAAALRSSGLRIEIIALDEVSRHILDGDLALRKKLAEAFGDNILLRDSSLDRAALAACAFADDDATAKLNALVHPPTMEHARDLLNDARDSQDLVIVESPFPLIYLSEIFTDADNDAQIWTVTADRETRLLRGIADGFSPEDADRRMDRQPRASAYQLEAATVVENDGNLDDLRSKLRACLQDSDLR